MLPKAGLVYSERGNLAEVLCKPKIMPIKVRGATMRVRSTLLLLLHLPCLRRAHSLPSCCRSPVPAQSATLEKMEKLEKDLTQRPSGQ